MEKLKKAHVAIFGIGGVGGYVCEALARSGVGSFTLVDSDRVAFSNINRQIIATENNIGRYKTEAMKERILDIDPEAEVETAEVFYLPETADMFDFSRFSYVADAVDTVTAKLLIIERANAAGIPVISSMGAGNRLDPTKITVSDIYDTAEDPLARVMTSGEGHEKRMQKAGNREAQGRVFGRKGSGAPGKDNERGKTGPRQHCFCSLRGGPGPRLGDHKRYN